MIWDTDYVMNFNEMKMSIQLERSFTENAAYMNRSFSAPYFIKLLIDKGFLKNDNELKINYLPMMITDENIGMLKEIEEKKRKYSLAVVYVSKTFANTYPLDINLLAKRLRGIAHVWVQEDVKTNKELMRICDKKNEYDGAIGVYFPNAAGHNKRFLCKAYWGHEDELMEKVVNSVNSYFTSKFIEDLYTWNGVSLSLMTDRRDSKKEDLRRAENEKDNYIESFDADNEKLRFNLEKYRIENENLRLENQSLRTKFSDGNSTPVLFLGDERELYPGEIQNLLVDMMKKMKTFNAGRKRREDVLDDLIENNECKTEKKDGREELKEVLSGYKGINDRSRQQLENLGFTISEEGKHYKLVYYSDERYNTSIAKTPSDSRSGINAAKQIINEMM